jgi:DNA-directed RNA polymerase specialized sigma24 family protein
MATSDPRPSARGDEGELFREFNDDLTRVVTAAVRHVPHQTIEDACSFAWAQFLVHQPSRDRNWRSWLIRTAEREAWLLHRREGRADLRAFDGDVQMSRTDVSVPDAVQFKDDVDEALSLIKQLQPRLQRIAMMRGLGWRYSDISEVTGDSIARIGQLASIANQEIADRRLARLNASGVASPRVARLSELESHPPVWLTKEIGRLPGRQRREAGNTETRRAWRRAALALDDYRTAVGPRGFEEALESPPRDSQLRRLHTLVRRALDDLAHLRARQAGRHLGD